MTIKRHADAIMYCDVEVAFGQDKRPCPTQPDGAPSPNPQHFFASSCHEQPTKRQDYFEGGLNASECAGAHSMTDSHAQVFLQRLVRDHNALQSLADANLPPHVW